MREWVVGVHVRGPCECPLDKRNVSESDHRDERVDPFAKTKLAGFGLNVYVSNADRIHEDDTGSEARIVPSAERLVHIDAVYHKLREARKNGSKAKDDILWEEYCREIVDVGSSGIGDQS